MTVHDQLKALAQKQREDGFRNLNGKSGGTRDCACGCGRPTKSTWYSGDDGRQAGWINSILKGKWGDEPFDYMAQNVHSDLETGLNIAHATAKKLGIEWIPNAKTMAPFTAEEQAS